MVHHLNSFKERNQEALKNEELDRRHIELMALFEISQTLNSSLNLKSILDNILLVPMGRMMISKGLVLLKSKPHYFKIVNIKGLSYSLLNKEIHISNFPEHPIFAGKDEEQEDWMTFFKGFNIDLVLPLLSQRESIGFICYGKKITGQTYTDEEIEFLSSLTNIAIQAIENAMVFEELNKVNRELDKKVQELNTLFEIGKEFNHIFDETGILRQLSYSLMGQLLINQFFIALKSKRSLRIAYKKGLQFTSENLNKCLEFCRDMPELIQPLRLNPDNTKYSILYEIGVRVIVPMNVQNENGGYIFLGEKLDKTAFSDTNLNFLTTLGNMTMISIENARLFKEMLEKQTLEEELKQVGGDYFDIIQINKNKFLFTIADVSGKGMPASLLMSNLQAGLKTLSLEKNTLAEMTAKLNNLIHSNTSIEKYITFFILKLDVDSGEIEYVNAGHNPPLLFAADNTYRPLEEGGIILGMMKDVVYETGYDVLKTGECITMFTDGVTEAMDANNTEFSEKGVINHFQTYFSKLSSAQLNSKLFEELKNFCGDPTKSDDVTLLTIKAL